MLLYDVFVKLGLHRSHEALQEADFAFLSLLNFSVEDVQEAEAKKIAAFRRFAFDLKDTSSSQLHVTYSEFLTQCKLHLLQEKVTNAPLVPAILNTLETSQYLTRCASMIEYMLSEEKESNALVLLSYQFIDNSNAFFTCLKWMLHLGMTPEVLLSTHLLQDYVRYHMPMLGSVGNPVASLYQLLLADNITLPLALQMSKTRCSENELSYLALDGKRYKPNELTSPEKVELRFVFTNTLPNITALTRLFGVRFLVLALTNTTETEYLQLFLNAPFSIKQYLPRLLSLLNEYPLIKRPLAKLLQPQTIDELLQNHTSGLLSLIPFSSYLNELVNLVQVEALQGELEAIRTHAASTFDLVIDLSALFSCFVQRKTAHASLVFTMIIDALIAEPPLAEDAGLLRELHRFKPGRNQIVNQISCIAKSFESTLCDMVSMPYAFDIVSIQDMWRIFSNQVKALQLIFDIPSTIPSDKYQLYASIAGVLMKHSKLPFDLQQFMDALEIAPISMNAETDAVYERTLIELLITFDDANLRRQIIDCLGEHVALYKPWKSILYSGSTLLQHGVCHGNLGLIKWLLTSHPKPIITRNILNNLCVEAAVLGHWPIVRYFLKSFHMNQLTVDTVLHQAVLQNQTNILSCLWQPQKKSPTPRHFEIAFLKAVQMSSFEMTRMIIQSPKAPSDTILTRGFKQALNLKEYTIALEIASLGQAFKCLNAAVNQAVLDAARKNDISKLFCLRLLPSGIIAQNTIDDALVLSAKSGAYKAAHGVLELFDIKPRSSAKASALRHAEKKGFREIYHLLETNTPVPLSFLEKKYHTQGSSVKLPKAQSCQSLKPQSPVKIASVTHYAFFKATEEKEQVPQVFSACKPPRISRQRSV